MSYTGKNPSTKTIILEDVGVAAVTNPAASKHKLVNRSGVINVRDSSGAETALASSVGDYTKFVGGGGYATLTAAIAAAVPGDGIFVTSTTTEPAGDLTIGVADISVTCKPGAIVAMSGAMTNGLRLTAARIKLERVELSFAPSGAQARAVSVEAADCKVTGRMDYTTAQTLTDALHVTSSGVRAYVQLGVNRTAGTITNLETNNDGAGKSDVWGG